MSLYVQPPTTEEVRQALEMVLGRTGYELEQVNGQRKLYHPSRAMYPPPPEGCEVFVGRLPRDLYEDELVPPFLSVGPIYELRTMMNFSGTNRGFAFVNYYNRESALRAIKTLNNYEIRKGQFIGVLLSVNNRRLFIRGLDNIPDLKHHLFQCIQKFTAGIEDIFIYPQVKKFGDGQKRSAVLVYGTHRDAAMARRLLIPIKNNLFGSECLIDWDDPRLEAKRRRFLQRNHP